MLLASSCDWRFLLKDLPKTFSISGEGSAVQESHMTELLLPPLKLMEPGAIFGLGSHAEDTVQFSKRNSRSSLSSRSPSAIPRSPTATPIPRRVAENGLTKTNLSDASSRPTTVGSAASAWDSWPMRASPPRFDADVPISTPSTPKLAKYLSYDDQPTVSPTTVTDGLDHWDSSSKRALTGQLNASVSHMRMVERAEIVQPIDER